jgi:CheY-like chemotaxis protein
LSKPYSREQLALKIRHVLNNRQQVLLSSTPVDPPAPVSQTGNLTEVASGLSILVVEDEPLIRMATVDMLLDLGHSPKEAGSGEEALTFLEEEQPDVVLTDLGLPGLSGEAFCNEISQRWPNIAIIFATGMNKGPALEGTTRTALLCKPFGVDELKIAIATIA